MLVLDADDHAADIGFVLHVRCHQLHHQRISDLPGAVQGLVQPARYHLARGADPVGADERLGVGFVEQRASIAGGLAARERGRDGGACRRQCFGDRVNVLDRPRSAP